MKNFYVTYKERLMNLIRSLLGRRQFLIAFVGSTLSLAFGGVAKAFDLIFQTGRAEAPP